MTIIVNPVLPNILTNGTIADATQVMGNFAAMISQINTNAAENGTNNSITSLTGLTTPLSTLQGGTGQAGIAAFNLVAGNGTGPVSGIAPSTAGQVLASNGPTSLPTFQNLSSAAVITGLGFPPVQQGTGIGQLTDIVKIGWSSASGNGLRVTVDSTDLGYPVMSSSNNSVGWNVNTTFNASGGLFDNSNRVWSPVNYQPLTVNGIGYDCQFNSTVSVEGGLYPLPGRPGTWMCIGPIVLPGNFQTYRRVS